MKLIEPQKEDVFKYRQGENAEAVMADIKQFNKALFNQLTECIEFHFAFGISTYSLSRAAGIHESLIKIAISAYQGDGEYIEKYIEYYD
jgi:hypothetical protein